LAYDKTVSTKRPGILVVHEWLGINDYAKKGDINTKILAIQGDMDPAAPVEKQKAFVQEMKDSGADFSHIVYGNLPAHNFTNPDSQTYYEDEDNMAWASMLVFYDPIFK
jgi:dienelactone hydrolase